MKDLFAGWMSVGDNMVKAKFFCRHANWEQNIIVVKKEDCLNVSAIGLLQFTGRIYVRYAISKKMKAIIIGLIQ